MDLNGKLFYHSLLCAIAGRPSGEGQVMKEDLYADQVKRHREEMRKDEGEGGGQTGRGQNPGERTNSERKES